MYYSIQQIKSIDDLKKIFPTPEANELNFCLFSTSGVHGHYGTIEDCEAEPDEYSHEVTVLVVHPRTVTLVYGNVPVTKETAPYLKALRASSLDVVSKIGLPNNV